MNVSNGLKGRILIAVAVCGFVVALALHVYFAATWSYYLQSVPGYPEAFRLGHPPDPHLVSSSKSMLHGGVILLLAGLLVGIFSLSGSRRVLLAFPISVGVAEVLLLLTLFDFPGNLWPLAVAAGFIVGVIPAGIGVAVGITTARIAAPPRRSD